MTRVLPPRPPLIVYPLPPVLPQNPYLDRLYGAMRSAPVVVRRGRPRHELLRLLLGRGQRVLHLHFFDELVQRPSVFVTALRSLGFLLLLALLRLRGARLVWTAHNSAPHEAFHPAWGFVVYRCVARWSDAIIAHTEAACAMLKARYGPLDHCEVIPHGNYIGCYGPQQSQVASRAALGLPAEGRVVLCFGALRPYKQIEALIAAFAELPLCSRGTLVIAGSAKSPAYAASLARQAAAAPGVIVRVGYLDDTLLSTYLAAADLVALPYRALLTSGALLCAMSYARPVLAPNVGPVRELVRDRAEGFLFDPHTPDGLRETLEQALGSDALDSMGAAALERARLFDWPTIAARTVQVYLHVCAR